MKAWEVPQCCAARQEKTVVKSHFRLFNYTTALSKLTMLGEAMNTVTAKERRPARSIKRKSERSGDTRAVRLLYLLCD